MSNTKKANSLIQESSPYLLQHAYNPVNWMPWNAKSLEIANAENKLLLISIGYSSCHWCHVMEHESFEDNEVAAVMNKHFVNIKVDREERPDIDQIYMSAVQLITGRGGWPLNCIALPDGRPIWGGTYFTKENWINALEQLAALWSKNPSEAINYAEKLTDGIRNSDFIALNKNDDPFTTIHLKQAIDNWKPYMDFDLGGRRGAPKFPMPNNYLFLLRYAAQTGDKEISNYVNLSLTKMANGGIYDQVGGGFSRYSVDNKWHVPHFEKMLYDNGQLISLFSEAYLITKNELFKEVVTQTTQFIERELMAQNGAFYSSLDADSLNSEGHLEEGAFYVYNKSELEAIFDQDFNLFSQYYNINYFGYWENDTYVLIKNTTDIEFAKKHKLEISELKKLVAEWQKTLLEYRENRNRPRLDDKSLTSWNALMLKGYIDAYKVFNNTHYLDIALKNATFIYTVQFQQNEYLNHSYKNGHSTINGYLEDYATVIEAFIALYEVTFNELWLQAAKQLTDYTFDHFFSTSNGMFYFTSNIDAKLISRKIEIEDNVISASNSIMANNLFKLSHYFSNQYYLKVSKQMLHNVKENAVQYASGYSNWLNLMCNFVGNFYEIAVCGPQAFEKTKELNKHYIPNKIIAGSIKKSNLPILSNRFNEKTFVYVCEKGACQVPETEVKDALKQMRILFD
jgi:uncharacterized protein YyaL (SSP411 family)